MAYQLLNQFFELQYGDETHYFETNVNGEGYYSRQNGTILGKMYDANGNPMTTCRVPYSSLIPLSHSEIKKINWRKH